MTYACSGAWYGHAWLSVPLNCRAPPPPFPAKRRSGTLAAAVIPGVRMMKLFGTGCSSCWDGLGTFESRLASVTC
eukprot:5121051-Pleurochrysis_carterae.AAC.1